MAEPSDEPNKPHPESAGGATEDASQRAGSAGSHESDSGPGRDIEKLLDEATASLEQATGDEVSPSASPQPFTLGDLSPGPSQDDRQPIDLLGEVEMDLRIELGRTQMRLEEVLQLRGGSVVALDKLAGDPVDVFVNGRLIARGEVLVMNDNFCIRVTELVGA